MPSALCGGGGNVDVRQQRGGGTAGRRHRDRGMTAWMIETPCPQRHGRPQGPPLPAAGGIRAHVGAARRKHVVGAGLVPARVPNRIECADRAAPTPAARQPRRRHRAHDGNALPAAPRAATRAAPTSNQIRRGGPHRPISPFAAAQIRPRAPHGTALHEIHPSCAAKGGSSAIRRLPFTARGSPCTPGGALRWNPQLGRARSAP